jgi:hypothetical protein
VRRFLTTHLDMWLPDGAISYSLKPGRMWLEEFFQMNVHSQQARTVIGWILGIAAFSPFALCYQPSNPQVTMSDVTGRVTYSGRPLTGATICLDSESGNPSVLATLGPGGSFQLRNIQGRVGALPGLYHAFLYSRPGGTSLPAKFGDPRTSGLEIEIASGWNELNIDLH